ncbi:MAG: PQQ-binding-like beta-propeller repeat protein [Acidobacteria bacterium]|nr:PQQ-binding-like beta-propeller repeat protein [Acidobacteriota bacterium]
MKRPSMLSRALAPSRSWALAAAFAALLPAAMLADWPEARGPAGDGTSTETGLPARWSPAGENLAWRAPYGGRSAPIVVGDRVFLQNTAGAGDSVQERVMCLDANTGRALWEYTFNLYHSDVPAHRVGWASPAADPQTGNVYALGGGGSLHALTRDGKLLWSRSLVEEYGFITTHGGRTTTPILEGDLIILNALSMAWGDLARGGNRYFAIDKRTGQTVWISSPQQRHYDTNYSMPVGATVNETRLVVVGGTDGVFYALKAFTGQPVWHYEVSKRALNTSVVLKGNTVFTTHSEENIGTSQMGRITALDAAAIGAIGPTQIKWTTIGFQGGFASPVLDGDRLYVIDNGAVFGAFDTNTGQMLYRHHLGTIQKASPVLADGKVYIGTENGKFYILKPGAGAVEVLDEDALGAAGAPEPILAPVAVSNGRVFLVSVHP